MLVSLDTVVFINLLTGVGNDAKLLDPLLKQGDMGALEIVVSEIVVAESCRIDGDIDPETTIRDFLANPFIKRKPVTPVVSAKAAELIREYDFETCDAIIVATAILNNCETLYTRDNHIRKSVRSTRQIPADAGTSLDGMKIRSPDRDEELCRRAGIPVKGEATSDDEEDKDKREQGKEQARPGTGTAEGGGDNVGGGDEARPEPAQAAKGVAGVSDEEE